MSRCRNNASYLLHIEKVRRGWSLRDWQVLAMCVRLALLAQELVTFWTTRPTLFASADGLSDSHMVHVCAHRDKKSQ